MTPSLTISIVSAVIALGAAVLSLVAIWKTHFAKFRPLTTVGALNVRIYPFRGEKGRRFIPSCLIPISIANEGARAGKVVGLRLVLHFPDLPIPGNAESLRPVWEVQPGSFERHGKDRFRWLDEFTVHDWMPFIVLPKQTVTKHIVFETRWDTPVIQDRVEAGLEIYTDAARRWTEVAKWGVHLGGKAWSELTERGTCVSFSARDAVEYGPILEPPDLHKYTGTREPIPSGGFQLGPSYLDYPKEPGPKKGKDDKPS